METIGTVFKKTKLNAWSQLYTVNHLYCIREELVSAKGLSNILGQVWATTLLEARTVNGYEFCSKTTHAFLYLIFLRIQAKLSGASCTCKTRSHGWCNKHAAVAIFVNS